MALGLLLILLSTIVYAMFAHRLSRTIITAPMVFLLLGFLLAHTQIFQPEHAEEILHLIAEVALIILLFIDASKIDTAKLRQQSHWPVRMLLLGLPLCIGLGAVVAIAFFPQWPLPLIALVAAILAPTDAALGQAVVSNEAVPNQERQTLTAESGLNDGLALPVILFFSSLLVLKPETSDQTISWLWFGGLQVVLGPLVGIALGWMGARGFLFAEAKKWTAATYEGVAILALAGSAYLAASLVGGNGFISAFIAGLTFGHFVKDHCRFIYEFSESEGQMLTWASFLFIGLVLLPEALEHISLAVFGYILVSLFLIRPLAIYLSLLGTNTSVLTRLFFGWFGPRGLATALFALVVTRDLNHEYAHAVMVVAINAVWISALLHGITAGPGANWYSKLLKRQNGD